MNRDDLVHVLAVSRGLPKPAARDVVDIVLGCVEEALIEGGRVELRGFGSFSTRMAKAYTGHHPQTGEPIPIPERRVVAFKPGRALASDVARSGEVEL